MKKFVLALLLLLAALLAVFFLGPRTEFQEIEVYPIYTGNSAKAFAKTLHDSENQAIGVKPQAKAEVVFAKADSSKTDVVLLYLHGFSASRNEGSPVVDELGERYGANVYWTRLSDHGLFSEESYADANPYRWRAEAAQFLEEATLLGNRIIVIGTSTGATLALDLAARFPERVNALMLYSPNIALANPAATLINGPWGLQLSQKLSGGNYRVLTDLPEQCSYIWTDKYRVEGLVALEELLETTMIPATFKRVSAPAMTAYYYKDEEHKDNIISVEAAAEMMTELSTPENLKRTHALSEVSGHVITTECRTTGLEKVRQISRDFLEEVVGLVPNLVEAEAVN